MNLLLINYEFPPLGGGAGNATRYIAKELVTLGHQVTVLTTWFQGLKNDEIIDGFRVIRINSSRSRIDRSSSYEMFDFVRKAKVKADEIIKGSRPDHIISFFALPTGLVSHYLFKKYKIPYTLSLRGGDVPGFLHKELWLLHLLASPFTRIVWNSAHAIIANSHELKNLAEQTANKYKKEVAYIPNGVDMSFFKPNDSRDISDNLSILCVGRLVPQKRFDSVILAISKIKDTNLSLTIVGDGPLRSDLESMVKNNELENRVMFKGWLSKDELRDCYQKADLFVLPSIEEGMPNVVLEAMASGLPIIATNVAGNSELLSSGAGVLINSLDELKDSIEMLLNDKKKRIDLAQASFERSKDFSWMNSAKEYVNIIK